MDTLEFNELLRDTRRNALSNNCHFSNSPEPSPVLLDTVRLSLEGFEPDGDLDPDKWDDRSYNYKLNFNRSYVLRMDSLAKDLEHVRVRADLYRRLITLEASLPRIVYQHNVLPLNERTVDLAVRILDGALAWGFSDLLGEEIVKVPSVIDWRVSRADLFYNFRSSRFTVAQVRTALAALQPSARMTVSRTNTDETILFHNSGKRRRQEIVFYDKGLHQMKAPPEIRELAKGIVRLEVRVKDAETVGKAFGRQGSVLLQEIVDPESIQTVLLKKLRHLNLGPDLRSRDVDHRLLVAEFGPQLAPKLATFMRESGERPLREVAAVMGLSVETARRYSRILKGKSFRPAVIPCGQVLEELVDGINNTVAFAAQPDLVSLDTRSGEP